MLPPRGACRVPAFRRPAGLTLSRARCLHSELLFRPLAHAPASVLLSSAGCRTGSRLSCAARKSASTPFATRYAYTLPMELVRLFFFNVRALNGQPRKQASVGVDVSSNKTAPSELFRSTTRSIAQGVLQHEFKLGSRKSWLSTPVHST